VVAVHVDFNAVVVVVAPVGVVEVGVEHLHGHVQVGGVPQRTEGYRVVGPAADHRFGRRVPELPVGFADLPVNRDGRGGEVRGHGHGGGL